MCHDSKKTHQKHHNTWRPLRPPSDLAGSDDHHHDVLASGWYRSGSPYIPIQKLCPVVVVQHARCNTSKSILSRLLNRLCLRDSGFLFWSAEIVYAGQRIIFQHAWLLYRDSQGDMQWRFFDTTGLDLCIHVFKTHLRICHWSFWKYELFKTGPLIDSKPYKTKSLYIFRIGQSSFETPFIFPVIYIHIIIHNYIYI